LRRGPGTFHYLTKKQTPLTEGEEGENLDSFKWGKAYEKNSKITATRQGSASGAVGTDKESSGRVRKIGGKTLPGQTHVTDG